MYLGQISCQSDRPFSTAGRKGYWSVIFFQQLASIGNNLTIQIVAGQCMKVRGYQDSHGLRCLHMRCRRLWLHRLFLHDELWQLAVLLRTQASPSRPSLQYS